MEVLFGMGKKDETAKTEEATELGKTFITLPGGEYLTPEMVAELTDGRGDDDEQ